MASVRVLVIGARGFIGHYLVTRSKGEGFWLRRVDIKLPEFELSAAEAFELLDLRRWDNCLLACRDIDQVYNLAADMGDIGHITAYHASITWNNILINAHMLEAARRMGVQRFLSSSSACVYAQYHQQESNIVPLKEEDAYPAHPGKGYGWEKLFTEDCASTTCRESLGMLTGEVSIPVSREPTVIVGRAPHVVV